MVEQGIVADENDAGNRDFVTSIARAFSILRAFRRGERSLGNKEIAQRTGLPKSSVARITYTLTKLGYLEYLSEEEKYSSASACSPGAALPLGARLLGRQPAHASLADHSNARSPRRAHDVNMVSETPRRSALPCARVGERVPRCTTRRERGLARFARRSRAGVARIAPS